MGAIAVFAPHGGRGDHSTIEGMLAVSPHRGAHHRTAVRGRCAMGIATGNVEDAFLAESGDLAAVFTGTLDNQKELVSELLPEVSAAACLTPADVLLAGFRKHGDRLPARLRGVFSGAITDGRRVYCFRDHVGYGPLFFRHDGRGFCAATEAKQVVVGSQIPREPDLDVVARIYFRNLDDDTPCALRGVRRLPKATGLMADANGMRLARYWNPELLLETANVSGDEIKAGFDRLMTQAVVRSFGTTTVLSLSGGIDSPAIAAYGAQRHLELTGRPLRALTAVYPKYPSVDERRYVEPLARHYGLPLRTYEHQANGLDDIDRWTALADTPYQASSLAQYAEHYERARAWGFRTVLSGEHAEFVMAMQWNLLDHYITHGRFRSAWRELAGRRGRGQSWVSVVRLLARSVAPDSVMQLRRATQRNVTRMVPVWVDGDRRGHHPTPVRERWRSMQLVGFVGPGVSLEAEEVCQAVSGVRSRKPWTDIDLWEFFLSLPAEQKYPDLQSKSLVRHLLRGRVPDMILDRTDKTLFDEAALGEVDFATLRRYLSKPDHRLPGVDYDHLGRLLAAQTLTTLDYQWAKNLAVAHAFLAQW